MKKCRIISFLLSIIMMLGIMAPVAFAEDEVKVNSTAVPYRFRTELVNEKENTVKVWLELSNTIAENIASYQIAIQLQNTDSEAVFSREMSLDFDAALSAAKIKATKYDKDTQTLRVYVAGTQNLVQTSASSNILPIGIVTVERTEKAEQNGFKLVPSGNDGEFAVVDLGCNVKVAAEAYAAEGEEFVIPADGEVYGASIEEPTKPEVTTEKNTEPSTKPEPTTKKPAVDIKDCTCGCHKSGFIGFIYKVFKFFWKLFSIKQYCACGKAHW